MPRKRRRPRRGRFAGLYQLMSLLLIAAAAVVACVVFFRVHAVTVVGNAYYTTEQIIAASEVKEGDNLIAVGRHQVARRLLRQMPYLDTVSVVRKLPDGLLITVTECVPSFRIEAEGGGWWILDANGKILEKRTLPGSFAPILGLRPLVPAPGTRLAVHEEDSERLAALRELMTALRSEDMNGKVTEIDLSAGHVITLVYEERFTVTLPMVTDFAYRMRWLKAATVHDSVLDGVEYKVDMTIEGETRFIPK